MIETKDKQTSWSAWYKWVKNKEKDRLTQEAMGTQQSTDTQEDERIQIQDSENDNKVC